MHENTTLLWNDVPLNCNIFYLLLNLWSILLPWIVFILEMFILLFITNCSFTSLSPFIYIYIYIPAIFTWFEWGLRILPSPLKDLLHLKYPYSLQLYFVFNFKIRSSIHTMSYRRKVTNHPLLFSSTDFNADIWHNYMAFKCSLTATLTLSSSINGLSPSDDKDAELKKQFPFYNDLNKIS